MINLGKRALIRNHILKKNKMIERVASSNTERQQQIYNYNQTKRLIMVKLIDSMLIEQSVLL